MKLPLNTQTAKVVYSDILIQDHNMELKLFTRNA